jgi:hypothetical protein
VTPARGETGDPLTSRWRVVRAAYHVVLGLHSGVPACCVWAFLRRRTVRGYAARIGYAPCEPCADAIAAGAAPARLCDCDAGRTALCRWTVRMAARRMARTGATWRPQRAMPARFDWRRP